MYVVYHTFSITAMGKVRPFARRGLKANLLQPYSLTADISPDSLCAAGKILHRAQSAHPITKFI